MSLPKISAYPMPRQQDVPEAAVSWRVDPARAVLLIHDMQRYFLRAFPAGQQPVVDLVANITRLRQAFAAAGAPVVYTAQPGDMAPSERGLLRDFWGEGMSARQHDRGIIPELTPGPEDKVFTKWRYTAFHGNGFLEHLRELGRDQLVICGVYANAGCLITACDAFSHTIQPFLVADALADFTEAGHHAALAYVAELVGMPVTTDAVDGMLASGRLAA